MAEVGIREFKANASAVVDQVATGRSYVITRRGRPAAVLMPVEEAEDLILANAGEYVRMRRAARQAYARGTTTRLEDAS